jgi:cytochrome c biogenesis protein CcdA
MSSFIPLSISGLIIAGFGYVKRSISIMIIGLSIAIFPWSFLTWFGYEFTGAKKDSNYYSSITSSSLTVILLPFLILRKK